MQTVLVVVISTVEVETEVSNEVVPPVTWEMVLVSVLVVPAEVWMVVLVSREVLPPLM